MSTNLAVYQFLFGADSFSLGQLIEHGWRNEQKVKLLLCENYLATKESTICDQFYDLVRQWKSLGLSETTINKRVRSVLFPLSKDLFVADFDEQRGPESVFVYLNGKWESLLLTDKIESLPSQQRTLLGTRLQEFTRELASSTADSSFLKDMPLPDSGSIEDYLGIIAWGKDIFKTESPFLFQGIKIEKTSKLPFINPLDKAYIDSNPPVQIPWTDPLLETVWWDHLREKNGVKIEERYAVIKGKRQDFVDFIYKGLRFMTITRFEDRNEYELFSPTGLPIAYKVEKKEKKPVIQAVEIQDSERVIQGTIGYELLLENSAGGILLYMDEKDFIYRKQETVDLIIDQLQQLPLSDLITLFNRSDQERPLSILVSPRVKDSDSHTGVTFGTYNPKENIIELANAKDEPRETQSIYHELGHVLVDFASQKNPLSDFKNTPFAPFIGYHNYKLMRTFSEAEIDDYDRLLIEERNGRLEAADLIKLGDYRDRALERFVWVYAVEGGMGVGDTMANPGEDFADSYAYFYLLIRKHGKLSEFSEKEPFLKIFALDYLFKKYSVEEIGGIKRDQLYSLDTFEKVMGVKLDPLEVKANKKEVALKRKMRLGFGAPLAIGFQMYGLRQLTDEISAFGYGVGANLSPGYRWDQFAVGAMVGVNGGFGDRSGYHYFAFDGALWGEIYSPITEDLDLFLKPQIGLRSTTISRRDYTHPEIKFPERKYLSPWLGIESGLGFVARLTTLAIYLNIVPFGDLNWLEGGVRSNFDIFAFFR